MRSHHNPKIIFYEDWRGKKEELNDEEDFLTQLNAKNPRAIRRIVNDWQRLMKLVDIEG